jgi:ribonuclease HI
MAFTYNEYGEDIHRLFVPADDPGRSRIPSTDLVVYNTDKQLLQLQSQAAGPSPVYRDEFTLVVYIDGACRGNGTPQARASYGVYFGPGSPYNANGLLPTTVRQSSTCAEIEALAAALNTIHELCTNDLKLMFIKIATDSKFLVDAMTLHIEGWIEDGGIGSRGKKVIHYERMKELHELLDDMEYSDDGGMIVQFWHVDRSLNEGADALANAALDA